MSSDTDLMHKHGPLHLLERHEGSIKATEGHPGRDVKLI